ncbi:MAG: hypothetical protein KDK63_05040 [Chlamydiia bacterium]|nr:hypothetical protein [Chlamydiia bacterium]MCB1115347.1 hypothetical protein [Chlamydiia bacterium]
MNFKRITIEELAAIISEKLNEHGIDSTLVGGGCVSIYSQNRYQSYDLDYVTYEDMKKVARALEELGFRKKGGQFEHKDCPYFIEFVSPPIAIGDEPIHHFEYHKTKHGTIKMLTPTDSVKDRLASYYHWDDEQGLDQAIDICQTIPEKVNLKDIKKWSAKEGYQEKFQTFQRRLEQ